MTSYLLRKKLAGQHRFPMVLMLEPLHACNLSCTGCGRIREYADTVKCRLSVDQCLDAVEECGARSWDTAAIRRNAERFSIQNFLDDFARSVYLCLADENG